MTDGMQPQQNLPGPPAKKTNPLLWILGGCAVFLLIGGIAVSVFLYWGYHKAKTYVDQVATPGGMTNVAELWSDVPPMDGMTPSQQVDMPMGLKILARPILDGMMRGLNDGADPGHWDWTAFTLSGKTTADVEAFYTSERMEKSGWKPQGGCASMSPNGSSDAATFCAFQKQEGDKMTGLLIIAANDKENNAASLFFIRQEAQEKSKKP